ncbi:MAG: hypothetical protein NVS9B10_07200 [Nevskia sp.]
MQIAIQNLDTIQILDLEYDVAGVGSAETANAEVNLAAFNFFFMFSMPVF